MGPTSDGWRPCDKRREREIRTETQTTDRQRVRTGRGWAAGAEEPRKPEPELVEAGRTLPQSPGKSVVPLTP